MTAGARIVCSSSNSSRTVTILDYGAGNVRSLRNAIKKLGYEIKEVGVDTFLLW